MWGRRDRLLRRVVKQRFVVTQKTGPMFTAVLLDVDARTLTFADVAVRDGDVERPAQGHLYIDRGNVAYMQHTMPNTG